MSDGNSHNNNNNNNNNNNDNDNNNNNNNDNALSTTNIPIPFALSLRLPSLTCWTRVHVFSSWTHVMRVLQPLQPFTANRKEITGARMC